MPFQRLAWRIGLPFVLLVLAETVTLVVYMTTQIATEERARLETLTSTDAAFLRQTGLPASERMATDLQRVTGFAAFFRTRGELVPQPEDAALRRLLPNLLADGRAHREGNLEGVAVPLRDGEELVLVRQVGSELRDPRILQVLVAFWLLALLLAWWLGRGLVRPLRHLAAQLPGIESPGQLALPEAQRRDEIGDLARSFLRTRQALQDERDQRARAEQLAVLGRMTTALAHELQNPVAAIKMHAQLLRGGPAETTAAIVEHELDRIATLLNQWLFLGRPEPPLVGDADLALLLRQVVAAQRAQLDHAHVDVVLDMPGSLLVPCDSQRLHQVFGNLVRNATQAMPRGGTLTIAVQRTADAIAITFQDQGPGFSAAALARFGEFFFSEKEGGMGIGLSVSKAIVAAHGGSLTADNPASGGARLTVVLPTRAAAAAPGPVPEPPTPTA